VEYLVQAESLTKSFGSVSAVQGVSLQIEPGEIYGLVGPDGAGKTTLLRLLCGALQIDSGQAVVGGFDVAREPEQARSQLGYLSQRFSMYEDLSVLENIRFFAEVRGVKRQVWYARCMEILDFVGLAEFSERRAGHLSGGMKQKLGLAAALVHTPQVLLLDEPTTGVDPVTRQDFWQLIIRLAAEENIGVLVTTPYMDEATRCRNVGFMRDGIIIVEGTPATLRDRLKERILVLMGQPRDLLRALAAEDPDVENVQMFGDRLHLRVREDTASLVISRLQTRVQDAGGFVKRLQVIPAGLEDVFISLVEH